MRNYTNLKIADTDQLLCGLLRYFKIFSYFHKATYTLHRENDTTRTFNFTKDGKQPVFRSDEDFVK